MIEKIIEWAIDFLLSKEAEADRAKVAAHVLAPALVLAIAVSGVYSVSIGFDFGGALTVSELRTQMDTRGGIVERPGVALIVEPNETEYRIPLKNSSTIWTSLDEQTTRINDDRLVLTRTELRGQSPLVGVNSPVAIVVAGELEGQIWVPGGKAELGTRGMEPRRAVAFVSMILLVCVFAFGMSFASIFPSRLSEDKATAKLRADADQK